MSQFQAFSPDLKVLDKFFTAQAAYPQRMTTCKFCGASNVAWVKNQAGKSYLANAGIITREDGEKVLVANKAYPHNCADTQRSNERKAQEIAAAQQSESERLELVKAMQTQGIEFDATLTKEKLVLVMLQWCKTNNWK